MQKTPDNNKNCDEEREYLLHLLAGLLDSQHHSIDELETMYDKYYEEYCKEDEQNYIDIIKANLEVLRKALG